MDEATFLQLSVALTGFDAFDLVATGQLDAYRAQATQKIEAAHLQAIVSSWDAARSLPEAEQSDVVARMMRDAVICVSLKRIVMLWYTGSWYVAPPYEATTLSSQSYVQGLMWKAIGAHPMAAGPQGYGAWALPPPTQGA